MISASSFRRSEYSSPTRRTSEARSATAIGDSRSFRPFPVRPVGASDRVPQLVVGDRRVLLDRFAGRGVDNCVHARPFAPPSVGLRRLPAKLGVDNPSPRRREQRPFESWAELEAVAANLAPRYRPMVIFAAATGLRPAEWLALERRDIDRQARVVYVRRSFTKGRLKCTKTEASRRAVPLQAIALDAIERQPSSPHSPLLFPAERGGYLDLHNFRNREWKPAQRAAGIEPLRRVYDLRHTFATFALRAGISTFDLSRYMGASLTMIDRHYGHLARDGREHAIRLLDELSAGQRPRWTLVDAPWTPEPAAAASRDNESGG